MNSWGGVELGQGAFKGCTNLGRISATDAPDLTGTKDLSECFHGCSSFDGDLSKWNVSRATNMCSMFNGASLFKSDLSGWNTASVTNMASMFEQAAAFNCDLKGWNTSKVQDMAFAFAGAASFDKTMAPWCQEFGVAEDDEPPPDE